MRAPVYRPPLQDETPGGDDVDRASVGPLLEQHPSSGRPHKNRGRSQASLHRRRKDREWWKELKRPGHYTPDHYDRMVAPTGPSGQHKVRLVPPVD